MAVNYNAVKKLNEAKRQRQQQLSQAYEELGGSNPAYKPIQTNNVLANPQRMTATIPQLEKAVIDAYNTKPTAPTVDTGNGLKSTRQHDITRPTDTSVPVSAIMDLRNRIHNHSNLQQQYAPLYNDILNSQTQRQVNNPTPIASQQTIMGMGNGAYGVVPGVNQEDAQRLFDVQNREQKETNARTFAENHPILATLGSVVSRPIETGEGVLQNVGEYITGQPLSQTYTPSNIMRNTVSEGIDSNIGRMAYGGVNSIGDMALAAYLGGGASGLGQRAAAGTAAAIMGTEKASDVMNDAIERGLTPDQIMTEGVLSGASTAITEAIPFGGFMNGNSILKGMLSEGLQEGAENILDNIFDIAVTGAGGNLDKSALYQTYNQYINAGYDPDTALRETLKAYVQEVAMDAIMGGITGGLMQGGSNIAQGRNFFTGNAPKTQTDNNIVSELTTISEDVINKPSAEKYFQFEDQVREIVKENPDLVEEIRPIFEKVQQFYDENEENIPDSINENVDNVKENVDTIPVLPQTDVTPNANDTINEWDRQAEERRNQELAQLSRLVEEQRSEANRNADLAQLNSILQENRTQAEAAEVENRRNEDLNRLIQAMEQTPSMNERAAARSAELNSRLDAGLDRMMDAMMDLPSLNEKAANVEARRNADFERVINAMLQLPSLNGNSNVQTSQPVQRVTRNELSQAVNNARAIRAKLSQFEGQNARDFEAQIDNAINSVIESNDQAQALNDLNNVIANVNEQMAGEETGARARDINRDSYNTMLNVTDGRKIIATKPMLEGVNLKTVTQLNNATNTGTPNRIRFYKEGTKNDAAVSLDSVWDEMVEQSGNELPNVTEGDQLPSLMDYIDRYKSRKSDLVNTETWENLPANDIRSEVEREWADRTNNILDSIAEGNFDNEAALNYFNDITKAYKNEKSNKVKDNLLDMYLTVSELKKQANRSAISLDDDVKNIKNVEQAQQALDKEIKGLNMNLKFFNNAENLDVDEDVDTVQRGRVKTGKFRTSDVFSNTAKNSGILKDKQAHMHMEDGSMLMESNSEVESVNEAKNRIKENGYQNEYEALIKKSDFDNVDTDELMMIWRRFTNQAVALDEKGADSTSTWQKAYECLKKIKAEGSREGSALQALAKWSRNNTPEGLLAQAESIIQAAENGFEGYDKTENGWYKQIAKETKGKTKEMDVAFIRDFLTEARKLEGLDMDSRQAKHIMANLGKLVNSQIPVTLREKVVTLLMDNMLGNFRTLITRNAGGNIGFNVLEQKLRKPLSALIDKGLSKVRGTERTISENTAEGKQAGREAFKEALAQEMYDFANNIQSARSGENTLSTAVANNRQIFKDTNIFGKLGNFYNKLVKSGLSVGDRPFFEHVYHKYLTEYTKMFNDGKLGDMTKAEFDKLSKDYARLNALEAVYQDDSRMASAFLKMKDAVNDMSKGIVGADVLSQFTMPFVKTPANIIQRAIEYSPVGIAKNAVQTIREVNHAMTNTGMMDFDQQRFATETARNLIGSVLFTFGVLAAKSGILTGGYSDDKDMAQAQKEAGMQEYALHNPLGFNGDVDISWIPVLGNNAVAAAAAFDAANKPELSAAQSISQGLTAGLKSQFESSMLQGLQRLVGGTGNFRGESGDILTNAVDTLKSGGTQFIPSLARQAAAVMDPYRRQLSGVDPDDYYKNSILNSIPGLREGLQPRITRTGEYMEQNPGRNLAWKIFDNFINPANVTVATPDAVRDEAMRLYESTGNNIAFEPSLSVGDLKVDDHVPTAAEYTQYQQAAYGNMNEAAETFINSEYYQSLTDGDRESILADMYSAIKSVEKLNTLDGDKSNLNGASKAYDEGGVDGLIDYMIARNTMAQLGMSNTASNREQILQTLNQGGVEAVQQMVDHSQDLVNAGIDSYNLQKKYDHATSYIPSLTPQQFMQTWDAIDSMEKANDSITQKEMLAYLNQNPSSYDYNTVLEYWNAYGDNWGKQPYFDEASGTWKCK